MASLDRMEVDDNSSDGESSGEENPEAMRKAREFRASARSSRGPAPEPRGHREVGLPGRYVIIARADLYWRPGRHGRRGHRPRARSGAPREPGRRGPVGSRRRLGPGLSRCVSFDF